MLHILTPLGGGLVLWALSYWQTGQVSRLTLRLAIGPLAAVWALVTYFLEDMSSFSRVSKPMVNLVCLGVAAFTLLSKSQSADEPLQRCDWFWVSAGMTVYFGANSALAPFTALLLPNSPALVMRAYELKSVLDVFAFIAIARGVTCPVVT